MSSSVDRLDNIVESSARGLSRRRLFRGAGEGALAGILGTAFLWGRHNVASTSAAMREACQGNPICRSTRCYDSGYCHYTDGGATSAYRVYDSTTCSDGYGEVNCWEEIVNGYRWRCCDCCMNYYTGGPRCTTYCGTTKYACICRGFLG